MKSGRARRNRAWIVSGVVAAVAVGVGGAPAPGQVPEDPVGPDIAYFDAYGPIVLGYEDCDDVVHTEEFLGGTVYIELEDEVTADVSVLLAYSGSLADDYAGLPTTVEVPAGEAFGYLDFEVDELVEGELTVTALPGVGYTVGPEDTYTVEVTDDVEIIGSCHDDLGDPPSGTDRQTIDVGQRPLPLGFLIDEEPTPGPEPTLPTPPTEPTTTTEQVATTSTESTTTTTEEPTTSSSSSVPELDTWMSALRDQRAVPDGYDTPVVDGSVPPGLTYADDEWSGAATTPGTYAFDVAVCFDQGTVDFAAGRAGGARRPAPRAFPDVLCLGSVDVVVQVRAVAQDPAPPATPVDARADFAG